MEESIFIPDHIKQLISGHLTGSLSPDELSELKIWIVESPAHKKYFNEMRNTWTLAGKDAQTEKNLVELASKISQYNRRKQSGFWTWQRVAASAALAEAASGILAQFPLRFRYPVIETANNTENCAAAAARMGGDTQNNKMWLVNL